MSSENEPKPPKKNGSGKDPTVRKRKARKAKPATPDATLTEPVIKFIPASELATWPVYPFAEWFDMMPQADLKRLGDSLAVRQANSVIVWRGMILDGRNRIAAGALKGLVLRVEFHDELADEDIEEVILALNNHRRSDKKSTVVRMAIDYYDIRKGTKGSPSVDAVAKMFGVSRRTMFNHWKRERQPQEPPKPRIAFNRVPTDLHDVAVALSNIGVLKYSPTGRPKYRVLKAELKDFVANLYSQPEMAHMVKDEYDDDVVRDEPANESQDKPQDEPQDDTQDEPQDDVTM